MTRGRLWMLGFTVVLCACGRPEDVARAPAAADTAPTPERPLDVLLITIDTLRADALGAYGNTRVATPWIDRLAAAGVRFTEARAHNVVTLPAHASILSGLYPTQHGVRDNSGFRFPSDLPTLASLLRERGYRTGAFISAFPLDSRFGLDRGFEVYDDQFVGVGRRPAFLELERSGAETVERARRWIEADPDSPWFCWVHLYEPHFPYAPPEPWATRFEDDPYLGEVAATDAMLSPLLEPILAAGSADRTLVVLTSDHGEALGEHGEATHGIFAYESTLRVPLILYLPSRLEPRVVEQPVRHIDLLPTILATIGQPLPDGLEGGNLLTAAPSVGSRTPPSYFEALSGQLNRGWAPLYGVLDGSMKYIELPIPELYDLAADPQEQQNLVGRQPQRAEELRQLLASLRARDRGIRSTPEDAQTLARLESLGYLAGSPAVKESYTRDDDPKNLIGLDDTLQEIAGLYERGELQAALALGRQLVEEHPGMRMAWLEVAHLERDSGDLEAAIAALREAYALNPADNSVLALLGAYLTQAGRPADAVEITAPHCQTPEPDIDVLLVQALALARMQRMESAFATLEKARTIDPANPAVPVHLGTVQLMAENRTAAEAAYSAALALDPETVTALTALGIMAVEDGRLDMAIDYWRRAVQADSQQTARLMDYGIFLWRSGQGEAAQRLLELFVETAPPQRYAQELQRVRMMLAGPT